MPCYADSLYEVLGINQTASEREIKSAYRKKALKLHPDVNKAADAQKQFMEAKMAFETLSNSQKRAEYDRRLRMEDLLRDLDKEFSEWDKERKARRAARASGSSTSAVPKGLFDELGELGEEFVDFLEDALGTASSTESPAATAGSGSSSSSRTSKARNAVEEYDALFAKYGQGLGQQAPAGKQQQQPPAKEPVKKPDDDIDAMLAALKRKVKKT
ncbi:hypothetical protein QJQ45_003178 [Haematococcus lacustris]|nr:hypothetical protein QJQ45_003178 [Haematococcus lacustris]